MDIIISNRYFIKNLSYYADRLSWSRFKSLVRAQVGQRNALSETHKFYFCYWTPCQKLDMRNRQYLVVAILEFVSPRSEIL